MSVMPVAQFIGYADDTVCGKHIHPWHSSSSVFDIPRVSLCLEMIELLCKLNLLHVVYQVSPTLCVCLYTTLFIIHFL